MALEMGDTASLHAGASGLHSRGGDAALREPMLEGHHADEGGQSEEEIDWAELLTQAHRQGKPFHYRERYETERLGAFTDAVVAIVLTIGIIPLAQVEDSEVHVPPGELLVDKLSTVISFIAVFMWLFAFIENHNQILSQVEGITIKVVLLNCVWLLTMAVVPFSFIVAQEYSKNIEALLLLNFAGAVAATGQLMLGMAVRSLRPENTASAISHRVNFVKHVSVLVGYCTNLAIVGAFVATGVKVGPAGLSVLLVSSSILPSTTARWTMCCTRWRQAWWFTKEFDQQRARELKAHPERVGGRIAALADGMLGIVGTLTLLEVRPPLRDEVEEVSFLEILTHNAVNLSSFSLTFVLMLAYWTVHHDITAHVRAWTWGMRRVNALFMFAICYTPFAFSLYVHHPTDPTALAFVAGVMLVGSCVLLVLQRLALTANNPVSTRPSTRKVWKWGPSEPTFVRPTLKWVLFLRSITVPCAAAAQLLFALVAPEASLIPAVVVLASLLVLGLVLQVRWSEQDVDAFVAEEMYAPSTSHRGAAKGSAQSIQALPGADRTSVHMNAPALAAISP